MFCNPPLDDIFHVIILICVPLMLALVRPSCQFPSYWLGDLLFFLDRLCLKFSSDRMCLCMLPLGGTCCYLSFYVFMSNLIEVYIGGVTAMNVHTVNSSQAHHSRPVVPDVLVVFGEYFLGVIQG